MNENGEPIPTNVIFQENPFEDVKERVDQTEMGTDEENCLPFFPKYSIVFLEKRAKMETVPTTNGVVVLASVSRYLRRRTGNNRWSFQQQTRKEGQQPQNDRRNEEMETRHRWHDDRYRHTHKKKNQETKRKRKAPPPRTRRWKSFHS